MRPKRVQGTRHKLSGPLTRDDSLTEQEVTIMEAGNEARETRKKQGSPPVADMLAEYPTALAYHQAAKYEFERSLAELRLLQAKVGDESTGSNRIWITTIVILAVSILLLSLSVAASILIASKGQFKCPDANIVLPDAGIVLPAMSTLLSLLAAFIAWVLGIKYRKRHKELKFLKENLDLRARDIIEIREMESAKGETPQ